MVKCSVQLIKVDSGPIDEQEPPLFYGKFGIVGSYWMDFNVD